MISKRIKDIWEISSDYNRIFDYIKVEKVDYTPDTRRKR